MKRQWLEWLKMLLASFGMTATKKWTSLLLSWGNDSEFLILQGSNVSVSIELHAKLRGPKTSFFQSSFVTRTPLLIIRRWTVFLHKNRIKWISSLCHVKKNGFEKIHLKKSPLCNPYCRSISGSFYLCKSPNIIIFPIQYTTVAYFQYF